MSKAVELPLIDVARSREIFDRRARAKTGLSGEEFVTRWRAHTLPPMLHEDFASVFGMISMVGVNTNLEHHPDPKLL